MKRLISLCLCSLLLTFAASRAQTKPSAAGHWEGSIALSTGAIKVVVDLDRDAKGIWIGDIDIPERGANDLVFKSVSVSDSAVSFEFPSIVPGEPKFQGKLSEDGNTIAGDFMQGGNSVPMTLARAGAAKVYVPPKNAELPAKYLGKWEGSLNTPSGALRLVFSLENKEGAARGTIDSPDQGAAGIPLSEISVTEDTIRLVVQIVAGGFAGKLSDDGTVLTGDWTQGGTSLPLVLKKTGAAKS